ncbi:MAG TPA: TIGR03118 family protein [Blastocatellia bacterium]|nr:TIGR03118 family protein [Blastocatellia bacterium]
MFTNLFRSLNSPTRSQEAIHFSSSRRFRMVSTIIFAVGITLSVSPNVFAQHYQQTNLVSDVPGLAATTDPNLVNPWGLARSGGSPWWVADNGTGLSTLYNGAGAIVPLVVTIPVPPSGTPPSTPTGTVFNGSADFQGARFIFVTQEGTLSGWSGGTSAVLKVDNSGSAIYTGLALAQNNGANFLYAANFFAGTIDVFDKDYLPVTLAAGAFSDPNLPEDFAPFNVQTIGSMIFVAFAKQNEDGDEEVAGPGLGYVDAFDASGNLLLRLRSGRWMNAPWGIALAPSDFGKFSNMLLVGQFGSGEIAAFDLKHGNFHGLMRTADGSPLTIEGLWALDFGNGANAGPTNTLFFTAGIDDETHGLFGTITPIPGDDD